MSTWRPGIIAILILVTLSVAACSKSPKLETASTQDNLTKLENMLIEGVRYKVHLLCIRHDCDQGPLIDAISNHILNNNPVFRQLQNQSGSQPGPPLDLVMDNIKQPCGPIDDILTIANTYHVSAKTVASILYEYEAWGSD